MKTTKRILAIVLAALMLATMIPFAVSAAGDTYTLNVKSSKEGFNFEIIKVADINTESGTYTSEYDGIVTALNKGGVEGAKAVLAICDEMKWNEINYVPAGKWTDGVDSGEKAITGLAAGVYYIKSEITDKAPAGSKVQNRVIPIPYYVSATETEAGKWVPAVVDGVGVYPEVIDLASKAQIKPQVSKKIVGGMDDLYDVTAIGQDVTFELKADVTGSLETAEGNPETGKLSYYAITDKEETGFTFKPETVSVMFLNGDTGVTTEDFTVETTADGFKVVLGSTTLEGNEFYSYKRSQHATSDLDAVPEHAASPIESSEISMDVKTAMASLSDIERTVVTLFYIDDMPLKQVATITGLKESTLRSHLHRAREKMATTLNHD